MTEIGLEGSVVEEEMILPSTGRGEDYLLQDIVELANIGVDIGVTLCCGGTLVSGVVISGKKYFESLINDVFEGATVEAALKEALKQRFSAYLPIYEEAHDLNVERLPPTFIHLRTTTYHGPGGGSISEQGVLWRGRISQVDGFAIGNFGVK